MLIFLDTEFTDFIDCELISIGMVAEDGQYEFYAELTDYNKDICSHFVLDAVVPHLGKIPGASCTRNELTQRLWQWFATLPENVQIATELITDVELLWDALSEGLPENLDKSVFNLRPLFEDPSFNTAVTRYHEEFDHPWHHALHDAKGHHRGWLAWQSEQTCHGT